MSSDIDYNAIISGVGSDLVKTFSKSFFGTMKAKISNQFQRSFPQFEKHLVETHNRVSNVKILCYHEAPTALFDIYISPTLEHSDRQISDKQFLELTHKGEKLIVQSHGGSGKTFLMRFLWLKIFLKPQDRIPIFIELRGLNHQTTINLMTHVRKSAVKAGSMSEDIFYEFCEDGKFIFLFDGFDEIERDQRDEIEDQILKMAAEFNDCSIVVTGRPNERFFSWSAFTVYSCQPFSYNQFCQLIEKLPFDCKIKRKFQKVATKEFFTEHKDFLSNPLLAQMMLMTYRDNAEIPKRLALFYENCYLTLFLRHDALKEQFRRSRLLDQDEFRRLFSLFCFFSYLKSKSEFYEQEIRDFIKMSIDRCNFSKPVSVDEVRQEFIETVNLIQQDGTKYQFIHRSFQEYFSAHCAVRVLSEKCRQIMQKFVDRRTDKTFDLSYELHPELVISKFFIPEYHDLFNEKIFDASNSKMTPMIALNRVGFEMTFNVTVRQVTVRIRRYSFQLHQKYHRFSWSLGKVLGLEEIEDLVFSDVFLELHRVLIQCEKLVQKKIKKNPAPNIDDVVTLEIVIRFDGTKADVEIVADSENSFSKIWKDEILFKIHEAKIFQKYLENIGEVISVNHFDIEREMIEMESRIRENSSSLEADFGI